MTANLSVAAGWYPDPSNQAALRWCVLHVRRDPNGGFFQHRMMQGEEAEAWTGRIMRGRLWSAAGSSGSIALYKEVMTATTRPAGGGTRGAGRTVPCATTISEPLSAEVAARYTGVLVRTTLPHVVAGSKLARPVPMGWNCRDFGAAVASQAYDVHVDRRQDDIALFELFDPVFIERLAATLTGLGLSAFVLVRQGKLEVTAYAGLLCGMMSQPGVVTSAASGSQGTLAPALDTLVTVARDIHRRIEQDWQ